MDKYLKYLAWLSKDLSEAPSDPQSIPEFMARFDITLEEIKEFHTSPSFEDDFRKAQASWLQSQVPNLLHTAVKEAKMSKSVSDIEKLVSLAHNLKDKASNTNIQNNFFNLNDEKIQKIAKRLSSSNATE